MTTTAITQAHRTWCASPESDHAIDGSERCHLGGEGAVDLSLHVPVPYGIGFLARPRVRLTLVQAQEDADPVVEVSLDHDDSRLWVTPEEARRLGENLLDLAEAAEPGWRTQALALLRADDLQGSLAVLQAEAAQR